MTATRLEHLPDGPSDLRRAGRPRILHVCETFGSGVGTAVHTLAEHATDLEHTVLLVPRRDHHGPMERQPGVAYIDSDVKFSFSGALRRIASAYREIRPDIVHAHSSYAGVYVRCVPTIPTAKIVYSPHCFAFERTDIGRSRRSLFRAAEWALVRRTGTFAACSEREADLARQLRAQLRIVDLAKIPNVPDDLVDTAVAPGPLEVPIVVAVGRIAAQKDPRFFARIVETSTRRATKVRWVWIGDGDPAMRAELEACGVEVTGWLPRSEVLQTMAASHVLLHTAGWEANPLVVLEAAAIGLPVVSRRVPAMKGSPAGRWITDPREGAEAISRLSDSRQWHEAAQTTRSMLRALLEGRDVRAAVAAAYRLSP